MLTNEIITIYAAIFFNNLLFIIYINLQKIGTEHRNIKQKSQMITLTFWLNPRKGFLEHHTELQIPEKV